MAKRQENDYFEMLKGLAAYSMRAALALQGTLQQFDVTVLPQQIQEMHTIEHEADQANHAVEVASREAFIFARKSCGSSVSSSKWL